MNTPVKKFVEVVALGDEELDCMALLNEVVRVHGGGLDTKGKERVTLWLADRYKCPTLVPPGV